ncbi:unnamed protein product [Arabidopsis halleri]
MMAMESESEINSKFKINPMILFIESEINGKIVVSERYFRWILQLHNSCSPSAKRGSPNRRFATRSRSVIVEERQ